MMRTKASPTLLLIVPVFTMRPVIVVKLLTLLPLIATPALPPLIIPLLVMSPATRVVVRIMQPVTERQPPLALIVPVLLIPPAMVLTVPLDVGRNEDTKNNIPATGCADRAAIVDAAADRAVVRHGERRCRSIETRARFSRRDRPGVRHRAGHGRVVDHDRGDGRVRRVRDGGLRLTVERKATGQRRRAAEKQRRDRGGREKRRQRRPARGRA